MCIYAVETMKEIVKIQQILIGGLTVPPFKKVEQKLYICYIFKKYTVITRKQ